MPSTRETVLAGGQILSAKELSVAGVVASDGHIISPGSMPVTVLRDANNVVIGLSVTSNDFTYVRTALYTNGVFTGLTGWEKQ